MSEKPWRETPWGRIVRWIPPEPKYGATKASKAMIAIGVTNPEYESDIAKDGATRLHVIDRLTGSTSSVITRHCSSNTRPCWCWPDEERSYVDG